MPLVRVVQEADFVVSMQLGQCQEPLGPTLVPRDVFEALGARVVLQGRIVGAAKDVQTEARWPCRMAIEPSLDRERNDTHTTESTTELTICDSFFDWLRKAAIKPMLKVKRRAVAEGDGVLDDAGSCDVTVMMAERPKTKPGGGSKAPERMPNSFK